MEQFCLPIMSFLYQSFCTIVYKYKLKKQDTNSIILYKEGLASVHKRHNEIWPKVFFYFFKNLSW